MPFELGAIKKTAQTLKEAIELHEARKEDVKLALALRDAVIKRFEYTYELAWKLMQRWISVNVSPELAETIYTQKELFRKGAQVGLIKDPLSWFEYHKA